MQISDFLDYVRNVADVESGSPLLLVSSALQQIWNITENDMRLAFSDMDTYRRVYHVGYAILHESIIGNQSSIFS